MRRRSTFANQPSSLASLDLPPFPSVSHPLEPTPNGLLYDTLTTTFFARSHFPPITLLFSLAQYVSFSPLFISAFNLIHCIPNFLACTISQFLSCDSNSLFHRNFSSFVCSTTIPTCAPQARVPALPCFTFFSSLHSTHSFVFFLSSLHPPPAQTQTPYLVWFLV